METGLRNASLRDLIGQIGREDGMAIADDLQAATYGTLRLWDGGNHSSVKAKLPENGLAMLRMKLRGARKFVIDASLGFVRQDWLVK